jgi:hypothetical protein
VIAKPSLSNEIPFAPEATIFLKNETARVRARPNIRKNKPIRKILVDCFLKGIKVI